MRERQASINELPIASGPEVSLAAGRRPDDHPASATSAFKALTEEMNNGRLVN